MAMLSLRSIVYFKPVEPKANPDSEFWLLTSGFSFYFVIWSLFIWISSSTNLHPKHFPAIPKISP